jgi:hypothetical protein
MMQVLDTRLRLYPFCINIMVNSTIVVEIEAVHETCLLVNLDVEVLQSVGKRNRIDIRALCF